MFSLIAAKEKDLGGFTVRRLLPQVGFKTVGPFVFLDVMGPAKFPPGMGMDVRPHPHIGLSTLTYLFHGRILHRDSLGNEIVIKSNEVNWMTAGRGIVHSERFTPEDKANGQEMYGLQFWVALPPDEAAIDPSFQHLDAPEVPAMQEGAASVRLVIGEWTDKRTILRSHTPTILLDIEFIQDGSFELKTSHAIGESVSGASVFDFALLLVKGESVKFSAQNLSKGPQRPGELLAIDGCAKDRAPSITISGKKGDRLAFFGGERLPIKPTVWWNFVAYDKSILEEAKEAWRQQKFPAVPGEVEFTPLPEDH